MATNAQKATPNQLDEAVINFNVYVNTDRHNNFVGIAELDLPTLENKTVAVSGSMISGEPNIPVLGHIGDMTLGITFKSVNSKTGELLTPGEHVISAVAAVQRKEIGTGNDGIRVVKEKYMMTVQPKSFDAGTLRVAALQDTKLDFTVTKYQAMEYDEKTKEMKTIIDVDPLNFKYVVNGKDYLEEIRNALELN